MKQLVTIILLTSALQFTKAQTELHFNNLDSLLLYTENNSYTIKNNQQKTLLAKWQKIAAQTGIVNFKMQTNFNMTNNLKLPVTYLPAEAFGGTPGTFKEVTTGQQYMSNLNILPQIDLFNLSSWAKLKSTKIDSKLTQVTNKLTKKFLFESIAASYYNIISLQSQIETTINTLKIADSLLTNIQRKHNQGLIRLQDLNDAKVNQLTTSNQLQQLKKSLKQQKLNLKILCGIPSKSKIVINEKHDDKNIYLKNLFTNNDLKYQQSLLELDKSKSEIKRNKFLQLPVLSFAYYNAWQQNSNDAFFDNNINWTNSQYIGLRLNIPFPNINAHTQTKMAKINAKTAQQNAEHIKLQNELENKQMTLDYEKALSQFETNKQITILKEENYNLMLNQFNEGVLATDKLLIAFNDMLISRLNYNIAYANLLYNISKININNQIN